MPPPGPQKSPPQMAQNSGWKQGGNTWHSSTVLPGQPPLQPLSQQITGVRACSVPYKHLSTFPGLNGAPVGALCIRPVEPRRYSRDGILAEVSDLYRMALTAAWQGCLPLLHQQLRPWVARSSTVALQWLHSWGRQRGVPSLRPMAIWVVSSSMRNPSEGTGRAFSKAPDSFLPAAKRRINIILLCNVGYDRAQLACMCPKSISLQLQPELSCLLQKNLPFCLLHGCHPRQQYHLKQK